MMSNSDNLSDSNSNILFNVKNVGSVSQYIDLGQLKSVAPGPKR